ncbi:MAG TPA: P-II family nitrogen regulator [Nitrospinae bacterium]|nr:P-II family nitrogen regulator [Nitrospinota bacterium]
MIKCFIKHEKLEEVREKLFELGIPGLSTVDVKGHWQAHESYEVDHRFQSPAIPPRCRNFNCP